MKNFLSILCALCVLLSSTCASIVSKSTYPLLVNTAPASANVVVKNEAGVEIFSGHSPATVNLKSGSGFFKKASYSLTVSAPGYQPQTMPINFKLDGWYFGNLLFGGFIGMLIIDPATGAMYKIEQDFMTVNLVQGTSSNDTPQLQIYDLNEIPSAWRSHLVELKAD